MSSVTCTCGNRRCSSMIELKESRLLFEFDVNHVVKFDDTPFYNYHFKRLQGSKGVDFIGRVHKDSNYFLIEVKNFSGHEHEKKTQERIRFYGDDSIIVEVAQKVRDSLSCLIGANRATQHTSLDEFTNILDKDSELKVIFVLEGDFPNPVLQLATMNKELANHLSWLNVKTLVVNRQQCQESWLKIIDSIEE